MSVENPPVPIGLDNLILDPENPRLIDAVTDERAAVLGILQDQGAKLVTLAQHIAEHNLSPIDLTLVYPTEGGKYLVAEGNRRVAALKVLQDASIVHGGDPKLVKRLAEISANAKHRPVEVLCAVLQSEAERIMWVRLRHTGLNQGRGLSEWSAKEQTRFMARHDQDRTSRMEFGLHVVELVRARCALTREEEAALRVIPITTLERMLGDPAVRQALGIERSPEGVKIVVDDERSVVNSLKDLVLEIAGKKVKVGALMTKENRAEQMTKWPSERKPGLTGEPAPARLMRLDATITGPQPPPTAPTKAKGRYAMPRSPDHRKVLVPPAFTLKITDPKVRRIFIELKKLDVEEFENAVSVLLRVFLELSVEGFLTAHSVPFFEHDKLRKKMEKAADKWECEKTLTKSQLTRWRNAAGSFDLFSVNMLHSYVHSAQSIPKKRDLLKTWDEMEMYFKNLWP